MSASSASYEANVAKRPVFIPLASGIKLVKVQSIEFRWFPGMSAVQKKRSIQSLHACAKEKLGIKNILEISTKSCDEIGRDLSAFNLRISIKNGKKMTTLESAYQSSKVFEMGGPFRDIFDMSSKEAKRDGRLRSSGDIVAFVFNEEEWETEPKTAFYDWLYILALYQNWNITMKTLNFDGFTDIEFNPDKSFSSQAYAAALFVSLYKRNLLRLATESKESFLDIISDPGDVEE